MKYKRQLVVSVVVGFSILTGYLIVYAFFHREKGDLVYIIFNSYALLAVLLSFLIVLRREKQDRHKKEITRKRLM